MTKAQGHEIFSGHRQSMCQVSASNHYPLQNIWPRHELCNFLEWPSTCTNDLGLRSWHTLRSYAIFLWSRDFPCFSIRKIKTRHKLYNFLSSYLALAQMTLGQDHNTPSGCKQPLCEVGNCNVPPLERYGPKWLHRQTDRQGDSYIPKTLLYLKIIINKCISLLVLKRMT